MGFRVGNGSVVKGFHHGRGGQGGLVTPPSPYSLGADTDRPRQRGRSGSSWARGRSALRGGGGGGGEEVEMETIH
jgi:hypothetical protein